MSTPGTLMLAAIARIKADCCGGLYDEKLTAFGLMERGVGARFAKLPVKGEALLGGGGLLNLGVPLAVGNAKVSGDEIDLAGSTRAASPRLLNSEPTSFKASGVRNLSFTGESVRGVGLYTGRLVSSSDEVSGSTWYMSVLL